MSDALDQLELDDDEMELRKRFFELSEEDYERLRAMRERALPKTEQIVEEFYELLLDHPHSRSYFADPSVLARVKKAQTRYFREVFEGSYGREYATNRVRVGEAHERIGLDSHLYLGAYSRYLRLLLRHLNEDLDIPEEGVARYESLIKMVMFDIALSMDAYNFAFQQRIERHQAAIRELSTPVIRLHERVMLLPLVGTVDSLRARQIMQTVLSRVAEERARVVLIDIAGVAVVDTEVAGHLMKTARAVRLLGAHVVLTGISAQVASTIVELGLDLEQMHTRGNLEDGLRLALSLAERSGPEGEGAADGDG